MLLAATVILLTLMSCVAAFRQIGRPLDHDEAEHLHASWLIGEGKRIYRDFMEDHPPFLYQVLLALEPQPSGTPARPDMYDWSVRSRLFTALCGTLSVLAAGLGVWRMTRSGGAFAITVGALFGAHYTWLRGLAEIRADAPTLALLLIGFLLLIWDEIPSQRMAWLLGCGIALAIAAEIWNPKWPLEGAALGVFFVIQFVRLVRARPGYAIGAIVPGVIVGAVAYLALTSVTSVRDYVFFNFILKSQNLGGLESQAWISGMFAGLSPTHLAPPRFVGLPLLAVVAIVVASLVWQWQRLDAAEAKRWLLVLGLVVAAALEVRFVYPWPNLWPQFFLMLAYAAAMAYGLAGAAIARVLASFSGRKHATEGALLLLMAATLAAVWTAIACINFAGPRPWTFSTVFIAMLVAIVPLLLAIVSVRRSQTLDVPWALRTAMFPIAIALAVPSLGAKMDLPIADANSASWPRRYALLERLAPGETVWIAPSRHPLVAPDASYFWYSFPDLVPMTLARIAANPSLHEYLPNLAARDIPLCQLARREAPSLRFIEIGAYVMYVPGACACAQTVLARPDLAPTPIPSVYEIVRPGTRPMPNAEGWDGWVRERIAAGCASPPAPANGAAGR